jgi:hypothetical protein
MVYVNIYRFDIGSSPGNNQKIVFCDKKYNRHNIIVFEPTPQYLDKFKYYFMDNRIIIERVDSDQGWDQNLVGHMHEYIDADINENDNNKVYDFCFGDSPDSSSKTLTLNHSFHNNNTIVLRDSRNNYKDSFGFTFDKNTRQLTIRRKDEQNPWLFYHNAILFSINIPKNIYACYKTKNVPNYVRDDWINLNPDYNFILYDDDDCRSFLKENFGQDHVNLFNFLRDGAIKADFWRICILYMYGGVYVDVDVRPHVPIKDFMEYGTTFLTCGSISENEVNPHLIITHPGNIILKKCIDYFFEKYRSGVPYEYGTYSIVGIMSQSFKDIFSYYINGEGIHFDGNYCNKYQFLSENGSFGDMVNIHCDYKGRKIVDNRRPDYCNHKY